MYQPTIQFLILWTVSFKGWKLEMETFLKKYPYFYDFYRIAYICKWWYQIYINYTEVWRQKLFQWNFLSYRQKWDFKVFFVYDVIIYLNGINAYNFKWPSIYRVACPMYLWKLHFSIVSEARNSRVTFLRNPQMKVISFQNGKHGHLMQYLIRQSFEGYCCESEYNFFS